MNKPTVAVLFGGQSPEHAVSLRSAGTVLARLDRDKYDILPIGITSMGEWFRYTGDAQRVSTDRWQEAGLISRAAILPDSAIHGFLDLKSGQTIRLDCALPILHGKNGEDGTVQGLLELAGIPIAGCGSFASALCMEKGAAHAAAASAGIAVPRGITVTDKDCADIGSRIKALRYPLYVKPARAGSSFGISRVEAGEALPAAIRDAFAYDDRIVIEEEVPGFEVGCAVIGTDKLTFGVVDEVECAGVFDYAQKYTDGTARVHAPARIPEEKANEIKETATLIYRALGCAGFARVDMFLTPGGRIVFNEVNTIPGLTSHSRFPVMLERAGISFETFLDSVIGEALK